MLVLLFKIFFVLSIILIIIGLFESERNIIPPRIVEYRYVPRTMQEELKEPASLEDIHASLFEQNEYKKY